MKKRLLLFILCFAALCCTAFTSCSTLSVTDDHTSDSSGVSKETGDVVNLESGVEFYSKGQEIILDETQKSEVRELAEMSVKSNDSTLNTIITDQQLTEAKQTGIAVTVRVSGDQRENIYMIISEDYEGLACRGGGSAHLISSNVGSRLLEIAGWEEALGETPAPAKVTDDTGVEVSLILEGEGKFIEKKDIQPLYDIAKRIVGSDENEVKLLLTGEYVNAVQEQGAYIDIMDTNSDERITLFVPRGHSGIAVYNDLKTYEIADSDRADIDNLLVTYSDSEHTFDYDLLDDSPSVNITYYGKTFMTDSTTKEAFKALILSIIEDGEDNLLDLSYPDNIKDLATEKGVYAEVEYDSEIIQVVFANIPDYDDYSIVIYKGYCYDVSSENLKKAGDLLGITLN